ncbi:nucleotidyltransferase domain-containing protein [Synechocystis sp. LKSZ1]|uniref:nucleotidyltransferase domain-containing protein n=1 Tax=Synechocystis sp. LKSZ1 TaxID=3144951 RepID=UPI00336C204F
MNSLKLSSRDLKILQEFKVYLSRLYQEQLDKVILFGSRARGNAGPESDFDILIVLKDKFSYYSEVKKISGYISDLCIENEILISCVFTTLEKWNTEDNAFYRNVHLEGISL